LAVISVDYVAPDVGGLFVQDLQLTHSGTSSHSSFNIDVTALQTIGQYISFPDNAGLAISANSLYGQAIAVTRAAVLMRFGLISNGAGFRGRMALYTDQNNKPDMFVASSDFNTISNGKNEISLGSPLEISSGTYWIMGNFDNSAPVRRSATDSVPQTFTAMPINMPLPSIIPSVVTTSNGELNFYISIAN